MPLHHDRRRPLRPAARGVRRAFTLIELLTVFVILSILAGLTLSGLAGARQRAKIDKTRSTIRKIHEIVMPLYDSYVERRVAALPGVLTESKAVQNPASFAAMVRSAAGFQVASRRMLAAADMPDLWDDAWDQSPDPTGDGEVYWGQPLGIEMARAPNARYQAMAWNAFVVKPGFDRRKALAYESAECLQMIVIRGGHAADAVEQFRADEIGDFDKDGMPEFHDGWGRPISFIRWPVGFKSVLQPDPSAQVHVDSTLPPDPMDPLNVTRQINGTPDRAVVPLIYSGGPNNSLDLDMGPSSGAYGLVTSRAALVNALNPQTADQALEPTWQVSGWINIRSPNSPASAGNASNRNGLTTIRWPGDVPGAWAGAELDKQAASDNITNHDLVTK